MHYERPTGLFASIARNAPSLAAEFRDLAEVKWIPPRGKHCTFCDYGAADAADAARVLFDTPDYLLVDRPFSFDAALHTTRPKDTAMSFLHILVLPKAHISCAAAIPAPAMIDGMRAVFDAYLAAGRDVRSATIPLLHGLEVTVRQSSAVLALITREWAKTRAILACPDTAARLAALGLKPDDVARHFADHARALSGVDLTAADFATFFHLPPSIWHLHMHVALADEAARTHAVGFLDKYSIGADAVKQELSRNHRRLSSS